MKRQTDEMTKRRKDKNKKRIIDIKTKRRKYKRRIDIMTNKQTDKIKKRRNKLLESFGRVVNPHQRCTKES